MKVNGVDCGTLWKEPFCADITEAVKAGENTLEVTVINTWPNRIIGDAQPDAGKPVTYTSYHFYNADSALFPAGLLGPVQVTTIQ